MFYVVYNCLARFIGVTSVSLNKLIFAEDLFQACS